MTALQVSKKYKNKNIYFVFAQLCTSVSGLCGNKLTGLAILF